MSITTLITVATAGAYRDQANTMITSAYMHFRPSETVQPLVLPGIPGPWPTATITRPKVILDNWNLVEGDHVYCIDADMRFDSHVGDEILGELVATQHPGYVGHDPNTLPYERDAHSACCIPIGSGERYYAGGFYGGSWGAVFDLLSSMEAMISLDLERVGSIRWNDESALNACLFEEPPTLILPPAYCCPDNDAHYRSWWPEQYERKIVALDKTPEQRGERGMQA